MKRWYQVLGMAMLIGALLLGNWAIFDLGRFGTCATGGPYVSARECAPGTELKMLSIFGATALGLAGLGLARSARVGIAAWGLLFTSLAITFVMIADGPAAGDNGFGITAIILAVVFFLMGVPGLLAALHGSDDDNEPPRNVVKRGATIDLRSQKAKDSGGGIFSRGGDDDTRPPFMNG